MKEKANVGDIIKIISGDKDMSHEYKNGDVFEVEDRDESFGGVYVCTGLEDVLVGDDEYLIISKKE